MFEKINLVLSDSKFCKEVLQNQTQQVKYSAEFSVKYSVKWARNSNESDFWIRSHVNDYKESLKIKYIWKIKHKSFITKFYDYYIKFQCSQHCSVWIVNKDLCQSSVWANLFWSSWEWTFS